MRHFALFFLITLLALPAWAQVGLPGNRDSSLPIEITADGLLVQQKKEVAIFKGNVEAIQGDMNLRSDTMVVYYKNKQKSEKAANSVSKIDVQDNVFLSTPKETAQGDRGIYDVDKGNITLTGSVVLTQGENIIRGDKLVYDLKTGKSELFSDPKPTDAKKPRVKGLFVPEGAPEE